MMDDKEKIEMLMKSNKTFRTCIAPRKTCKVEFPSGYKTCVGCKHFKPIYRNDRMIYDCYKEHMQEGEACPASCSMRETQK